MLYDEAGLCGYLRMIARIVRGFSMPLASFSYISDKKLWGYTVIPLLLTAGIVAGMTVLIWFGFLALDSRIPGLDISDWPKILQWLFAAFQFILKLVVLYFLFSLLMRLFLTLFSVIVIPFLSPLVEKILAAEGITTLKISNLELVGFIFSSLVYNVKLLIWQSFVSLLLLLTGPLQPIFNFGASGYFVGRSYFDYVFEMLGRPSQFSQMAKGHRAEALGIGIFSSVFVFVPLAGAVLGPVLSVVAATRIFAEKARK